MKENGEVVSMLSSALTILHNTEGDPRVTDSELPCTIQCQGTHSSYKQPILFLETNVS